jgi:hypothetical protein
MNDVDPRGYSHEELSDPANTREYLVTAFEDSANWRGLKADEYPDDTRNAASRVALEVAARDVATLPDDDPRLVLIASFHEEAARSENRHAYFTEYTEADRLIGRHGFGPGSTQTTAELLAVLVTDALEASRKTAEAEAFGGQDA